MKERFCRESGFCRESLSTLPVSLFLCSDSNLNDTSNEGRKILVSSGRSSLV
jgi:hypothetical protein